MADYKMLSATECAKRILATRDPVIIMHRRPDGDAVGSACALAQLFRQLDMNARIISADPIPERLKFIPEHVGIEVAEEVGDAELISIDVASPSQLGELSVYSERISLMIDHHAKGEPFADSFIIPEVSSAAEVLLNVIEKLIEMDKVSLSEPLAYALYAAISSDTGRFCYSNTSEKTHTWAAKLLGSGIDAADINHRLFNSKSMDQIIAEGFVASNIRTSEEGKIAYTFISKKSRNELGIDFEHFDSAIDVVRSLIGVEVSFTVKETDSGELKVSLRSTNKDVASVAAEFGGGGHVRAAGCSVIAESALAACELIIEKIKKHCYS